MHSNTHICESMQKWTVVKRDPQRSDVLIRFRSVPVASSDRGPCYKALALTNR